MAGSNTRGGIRETKIAGGPEYQVHVEANTPQVFNPPAPKGLGGNPWIDVETGKLFPGAPGSTQS